MNRVDTSKPESELKRFVTKFSSTEEKVAIKKWCVEQFGREVFENFKYWEHKVYGNRFIFMTFDEEYALRFCLKYDIM